MAEFKMGDCDRCGRAIPKKQDGIFMMLKATSIRFGAEAYSLQCMLCPDCRTDFEKWIINKGDNTV